MSSVYLAPLTTHKLQVSSSDGERSWELVGNATEMKISSDVGYEDIDVDGFNYLARNRETTTVEFTMSPEGYQILTGQPAPKRKIERLVRTTAFDSTVKELEAARVAAGVPEHAKCKVNYDLRRRQEELVLRDLDKAEPIEVEFIWKEEVDV